MGFWAEAEELIGAGKIVIDRAKGSAHPTNSSVVYPVDYGYVEGTTGGDGHEIDLWRGSLAGNHLVGIMCTVDRLKKDAEVKLLIGCTPDEVDSIDLFYNDSEVMSAIIVCRSQAEGIQRRELDRSGLP